MALIHKFELIEKNSDINFIDKSINSVLISDDLILYITDSLYWIETYWNGNMNKKKNGLSYYGYSKIEGKNLEKLKHILDAWIELFNVAPDCVALKGNFSLDEDRYEKNFFKKTDLLDQLGALRNICVYAMENNMSILHNGI